MTNVTLSKLAQRKDPDSIFSPKNESHYTK